MRGNSHSFLNRSIDNGWGRSEQKEATHSKKKKRNPEREEKLTEEIRNEAPIDGIPEVRRRRDSSENRVQERIVAAVNAEDEESRDYKEREERAFAKVSEEANFLPSIPHLALEER